MVRLGREGLIRETERRFRKAMPGGRCLTFDRIRETGCRVTKIIERRAGLDVCTVKRDRIKSHTGY